MKVSGTKYQAPCVLVIGSEDDDPIFGDVLSILVEGQSVFFEFQVLKSLFCPHLHAHSLTLPSSTSRKYIIKQRDLAYYHPYGMYHIPQNGEVSHFTVVRNNIYE